MGPDEPVFFELCSAHGEDHRLVQRAELKSGDLEAEAGECFERPANIGRHFLACQLIDRGVSTWLVKVLTGHFRLHAEAFADGSHVPPAYALGKLRTEIEALFDSLSLEPPAGIEAKSARRRLIVPSGPIPLAEADPYLNPKLEDAYRILPAPFDPLSTLAYILDAETGSGIGPGLFDTAPAKVVPWGLTCSVCPRTDEHAMQTDHTPDDVGALQSHRVPTITRTARALARANYLGQA